MDIPSEATVKRNADGAVRRIDHPLQPVGPDAMIGVDAMSDSVSARQLADQYLQHVLEHFELDTAMASDLTGAIGIVAPDEGAQLRFAEENRAPDGAQVAYAQTYLNLPVWRAGISVRMAGPPFRVLGAKSNVHGDIDAAMPDADARYSLDAIVEGSLGPLLHLNDDVQSTITEKRWLVYRFDRDDVGNAIGSPDVSDDVDGHVANPTLAVEIGESLVEGRHYVAVEVLFTLSSSSADDINWRIIIEPETGGICRLDSFVGCVNGMVYLRDPVTKTGDTTIRADSPPAVLDSLRDDVDLPGLGAPAPNAEQELIGEFVHVRNIAPPNVAPPAQPSAVDFDFTVATDEFSAVNAYYHCDRLFRMLDEMGFDVQNYFGDTNFPVRVDHRVQYDVDGVPTANVVNASAPGNPQGNGSDGFRFALVQRDTQVGMAVEWRVILHEFGHAILWDHLRSPNFRFAHSPGDSLAAILNDPASQAPDRSRTFPWTIIARRHNRRVEDGWGWGGAMDDPLPVGHPLSADRAGYRREQILSSTLFRYYLAIGGGHADLAVREAASRYAAFLIFSSVGALSSFAPPDNAEDYCDELIATDLSIAQFDDLPGRTTHKVVRWAFERQGLFQLPGSPNPVILPGGPPVVDVFIDDGRAGQYTPHSSFVFSTDQIWNRQAADGGTSDEPAVARQSNFLYVRASNRGTGEAADVSVRMFVTGDLADRMWPDVWQPLDTASVDATASIPSGGEIVVGPFEWQPGSGGSVTLMAAAHATGDPATIDFVADTSITAARLAHCDNNIAGRSVQVLDDLPTPTAGNIRVDAQPRAVIPDLDPVGVVSNLTIAAPGTVSELTASVTILHTWIGDLVVTLRAPDGTTVELFRGQSENVDNLIGSFDTTAPALAPLVGTGVAGVWSLRVVDRVGQDTGTLERWSLDIGVN